MTLADIPFVSLRHGLPDDLLNGRSSYSEAVGAVQRSLGPAVLVVDLRQQCVTASGTLFHLAPAQLALLAVFVRRLLNGAAAIAAPSKDVPEQEWARSYLSELRAIAGLLGDKDLAVRALRAGMDGGYFSTTLARLHKALKKNLGAAVTPYLIKDGGRRPRVYSLGLPASAVTLLE